MPPQPPAPDFRILLDLSTSLAWRGRHAVGIVRTEREIATRLLRDDALDVLPVIFHQGRICAIELEEALAILSPQPAAAPSSGNAPPAAAPKRSMRHRIKDLLAPIKPALRTVARRLLHRLPAGARQDAKISGIHFIRFLRSLRQTLPLAPVPPAESDFGMVVHPGPHDVLFLCGLGWDVIDCKALALLQRQSGMRIAAVIYDLIPIKLPQVLGGQPKDYFRNYFLHMLDMGAHLFCISQCTQRDLAEYAATEQRTLPPTSVIYLGADLPAAPDAQTLGDAALVERFRGGRFALTVSTFEVRKNYRLLLECWPELVKDPDFDLDLVIVGMPGWGVDDVIAKLKRSPLLGKRIFWLDRVPDAGLSWLYEQCNVFLFPSLYEGWGLPIIEAYQHGKPVISSNRGAAPEACMGQGTLIDIDDPAAWQAAIRAAARGEVARPRAEVALPTWEAAARHVGDTLRSLMDRPA